MSSSTVRAGAGPAAVSLGMAGVVIAIVSLAALAGAWGLEIFGNILPCPLCLEQRVPYYAAIPAGFATALLASTSPRLAALILALICAALIYNAGLGIYHAGTEWHFWAGPETCSGMDTLQPMGNLAQSLKHNTNTVRCDEAALRIFGISLAGYSVLISSILAALGIYALWRSRFGRAA
jgi:disulfide bond formation protein DsbB